MRTQKHIAENQQVIAELVARLADRDEEIARLKALCKKPVVLTLADVDLPLSTQEKRAMLATAAAVNSKLKERK